jgi:hypothetical protein
MGLRSTAICAAALTLAACGPHQPTNATAGAVFEVRACVDSVAAQQGEVFRILLQDAALIRQADTLLASGRASVVAGSLRAGDGGFNAPWSWHLDPASVTFPDVTVEVCDGCPRFVEANLSYWLQLGHFCPPAQVIARDR